MLSQSQWTLCAQRSRRPGPIALRICRRPVPIPMTTMTRTRRAIAGRAVATSIPKKTKAGPMTTTMTRKSHSRPAEDVLLRYQSGFASELATEALAGALPQGQNSPQKPAYGLYAEQLSGTAFTAPRHTNRRSWLYRLRPAAVHEPFALIDSGWLRGTPFDEVAVPPNQLRWDPIPIPTAPKDFIEGLITIGGNGDAAMQMGMAVHVYTANRC